MREAKSHTVFTKFLVLFIRDVFASILLIKNYCMKMLLIWVTARFLKFCTRLNTQVSGLEGKTD